MDWIFSHADETFEETEPASIVPQVLEEPGHETGSKYKMVF